MHSISSEHSPKLQIRSHSYLRAVSEVSINRSLDTLDPKSLLASAEYRSRNESYMRAMSTISQVCAQPQTHRHSGVQGEEGQTRSRLVQQILLKTMKPTYDSSLFNHSSMFRRTGMAFIRQLLILLRHT